MDDNEDHERIEEAGAPEESKQLESEKTSNYLKIDCFRENSCYGQSRRVKNISEEWKWKSFVDLHQHVEEHGDPGAWRDSHVKQHVLSDRVVLRVTPGEADHRGDDRQELSRLDGGELQGDLDVATVCDCHHFPHLVRDVDDVGKYDVALNNWLECRLNIDLNQLSP